MSSSFLHCSIVSLRWLAMVTERLHARPAELCIVGGAVYDALVAATAAEHGISLATRDRKAAETYRVLEIDFELIS